MFKVLYENMNMTSSKNKGALEYIGIDILFQYVIK